MNCSAVNVSNETLETVTSQAEEADASVQRSEDLLKVFGATLKMVNIICRSIACNSMAKMYLEISDSQFGHNANGKCIEVETVHDHADSSLFYGN